MRFLHNITLTLILLLTININGQQYNDSRQDFLVSKLTYKVHNWQNLEFDKFRVHFYGFNEAQTQAEQIAVETDKILTRVESYFDTDLPFKADIVVFNSYDDYYYSNINPVSVEEGNIGGSAPINRYRTVIYNTGNKRELSKQLGEGIVEIALNNIFFGGGWKDALKNNTLLDFPSWYLDGLKSYLAQEWSTEIDNEVRSGILDGSYKKYHNLSKDKAKHAGHAIWKYIADFYGDNVIPNIVYLTRISTNIESGFAYVLGVNLSKLTSDFYLHYYKIYSTEGFVKNELKETPVELKIKSHSEILNYTMSPDEKWAAYVSKREGKFALILHNRQKNEYKTIKKFGHKYVQATKDFAPILAWHPLSGGVVAFYHEKGKLYANLIEIDGEETKKQIPEIEHVSSAVYSKDGKQLVVSATFEGQSDIYTYSFIGNSVINLTNDKKSDASPHFLINQMEVIYSSTGSKTNNADLYKVDLKTKIKTQLTSTKEINEINPLAYGKQFTYLANDNGIYNRYKAREDSIISHVDTSIHYRYFITTQLLSDFSSNATSYQKVSDDTYAIGFNSKNGQAFYLQSKTKDDTLNRDEITVSYFEQIRRVKIEVEKNNKKKKQGKTSEKNGIKYEKEVVDFSEPSISKTEPKQEQKEEKQLRMPSAQFYEKEFAITSIISQLDHGYLNKSYQIFNEAGYINPGLSTVLKFEVSDLFNDHQIKGNLRLPFTFRGNEIYTEYLNKSKTINRGYSIQRIGFKETLGSVDKQYLTRVQVYEGKTWLEIPVNTISKLQFSIGARYDIRAKLGKDEGSRTINPTITLSSPIEQDYRAVAKAEYVINNSYSPSVNVRYGFRGKVFGEAFQNVINNNGNTFVVGADLRYNQKVSKGIVWANRFAASGSLGTNKVLYYLGGQDNWFFPQFNSEVALPDEGNFAFQSIVSPMRGFIHNSRNGTSFAVFNSELRIPLIKYFSVEPLRSEFLENFQIVGFGDVGSAWTGLHPYSNENAFNEKIIREKPLTIRIKNTQEPLLYGYGFGVRSKLFGYYMRFDWSYGIDDGVTSSVRYFTISLDI